MVLKVGGKEISLRDIADEAEDQLQNLKSTVQGQILAAHNSLSSDLQQFQTSSDDTNKQAIIDLETEHETITEQVNTLVELAESAGVDATSCVDARQTLIDSLVGEWADSLVTCIGVIDKEASTLYTNAVYIVDVVFNQVNRLEFQLKQCSGQLSCISAIVQTIQLDMIRLPQNIQTEVNAVETLYATLQISINNCASSHITGYIGEVNPLVLDVETCINKLLP